MNSNLNRALSAAILALGGAAPVLAQVDSAGFCLDPTNTAPYSADFGTLSQANRLFGAEIGVGGTVTYGSQCQGGGPVNGRIGFTIGSQGSIQDEDVNQTAFTGVGGSQVFDNFLNLTLGASFGNQAGTFYGSMYAGPVYGAPTGGTSYARVYVDRTPSGGTATRSSYLFGINAFDYAYYGRSGRYMLTEGSVTTGIDVRLVIDVLADAARMNWTITNSIVTTDTVAVGLWFGQRVSLKDSQNQFQYVTYGVDEPLHPPVSIPYVTIPGRRPLSEQERFNQTGLSPDGQSDGATIGVPNYANFTLNPSAGFGLQVVNSPLALTGFDSTSGTDQTQVDEFVIGEAPFLIDGQFPTTDPQFQDFIFNSPGNGNTDAAGLGDDLFKSVSYLQKWNPSALPSGSSRSITAYYRTPNLDSSYASGAFLGYSVSVDTPRAISTNAGAITSDQPYQPNPFTIRVNVDNTGGFSNASAPVTLQSTAVTLTLPAGMFDPATGSRIITKTIPLVNTTDVGVVDFQVQVDPNVTGAQQYQVTVAPQSGGFQTKTVKGSINVAAAPRLQLRSGANLVSPPWQFNDSSWESVLGLNLNSDFQSYTWDAQRQQYVAQVSAQRGVGTWIISQSELGYRALGGTPKQPDDEFPDKTNLDAVPGAGSPSILLHTGWNLVGNPYNYAFPIGNLVGVTVGGNQSLTFASLISQGFTNGQFAYYDQTNRAYGYLSNDAATPLPPNSGYWIYAATDFYLQFPPLYELFLRAAPGTVEKQKADNWKLQLSATSSSAADTQNFVGIAPTAVDSRTNSVRKPPMPLATGKTDVLSAYVTGDGGASMAKVIRASQGSQTYTFNVLSKNGGAVTVGWPNLSAIPSNLKVSVVDPAKKKTIDARKTSGYTVTTKASTVYPLTVTVSSTPVPPIRINTASYGYVLTAGKKTMRFAFTTTSEGSATVTVATRTNALVSTIASGIDIASGNNSVNWDLTDAKGQPVPNGTYVVNIKVVGDDGSIATRQLQVIVRR